MEPALFGLLGTLAGGIITALVTWLTNRHQLTVTRLELASEREVQDQQNRLREREEKVRRFAGFLSANWQAERYVKEVLDVLDRKPKNCVERVNAIIAAPDYQNLITILNDGLGWIGVLSTDSLLEEAALAVSEAFDDLMDEVQREFDLLCNGSNADTRQSRQKLAQLHEKLGTLSTELRRDLHGLPRDMADSSPAA